MNKWSWGENIGWMNWADANDGAQGVEVEATFLSGWIWCENVGWVTVGDGTPGGGNQYTNASGADHGVNIAGNGNLSGFAWGENIGWINFDTLAALGPFGDQARLDDGAQRFRGYAWGENVGWVNLDDAEHYVGVGRGCEADCDGNGVLNILDFVCFQRAWQNQTPIGDCDGNGQYNILDFVCYQGAFVGGCP
jgi:hypothetical protein